MIFHQSLQILSLIHISVEEVLPGDVDKNDKVDLFDYILLKQYLSHKKSDSDINKKAADINGDGKVNVKDLLELRTMF